MHSDDGRDFVRLLENVLAPIEPPATLAGELEQRLTDVQSAAIEALEELSDWEAAAFRDPRNWVRPAAAVAIGTAAGAALVVLRVRQSRKRRSGLRGLARQSTKEVLGALEPLRARLK